MNLAISNFAWDYDESEDFFSFLNENNINLVELVLTKYKNWNDLNDNEILKYKEYINKFNIKIYSLQSIFFNVDCSIDEKNKIITHLKKLIDYSEILNVKKIVFGSPNLRKKSVNFEENLFDIFFEIDKYLNGKSISLIIEPNSKIYKGEFFFTVEEIVNYINLNKFNNIKTMIDTHNSVLENKNPIDELNKYFNFIDHIHISEPELKLLHDFDLHEKFSNELKKLKYNKTLTYEVKKSDNIKNSILIFNKIYK